MIAHDRQGVVLLVKLNRCARSLEIKADGDFMLGLDDGVVHLRVVDFAHNVKGVIICHGWSFPLLAKVRFSQATFHCTGTRAGVGAPQAGSGSGAGL